MSQQQAVTKTIATRYQRASRAEKGTILDELCATTGWHRNHARRALGLGLGPRVVRPRLPRTPAYGADVMVALRFCWAVLGAPTGKRLAPVMGSLLKDAIAVRTWAQWDDAAPGFVEIDLVGHEGGNALSEHAYTLTVTDIATGWTENRSVPNKARKWVPRSRTCPPWLPTGTSRPAPW